MDPEVVSLGEGGVSEEELLVHDPKRMNPAYATMLAEMHYPDFPTPLGVLRQIEGKETYEDAVSAQLEAAQSKGEGDLDELLVGSDSWIVE
jgi:2-oxoglutarate ferredoxin oxidoreductase subunit beta